MNAPLAEQTPNIVALPVERRRPPTASQRFKIVEFENRAGSKSYRVTGTRRNGERVRENFAAEPEARCRQIELETEYLQGHAETAIQATKLTPDQLRLSEAAIIQLGDDWTRILDAATYWQQHGKHHAIADSPRLDDAFSQFKAAVAADTSIRHLTRLAATTRVNAFVNSTANMHVCDVLPETVLKFLDGMKVGDAKASARTRINYCGGISKFFTWCMDRERRWIAVNPCTAVKIKIGDKAPPHILSLEMCERLLRAAEKFKDGRLLPYLTLTLFCGLRPFEARRIQWGQVNFQDRELRIEANQSKVKRGRTIALADTELKWLRACKRKPFGPDNLNKDFAALIRGVGFGTEGASPRWTKDVLRHTAISHYFRLSGSYGRSAERFGNSEAIIKANYQGRVTSDDTKKFYALRPKGLRK
jgi:integrase